MKTSLDTEGEKEDLTISLASNPDLHPVPFRSIPSRPHASLLALSCTFVCFEFFFIMGTYVNGRC